mmetsp:Transcript_18050/g.24775  ORF Transcript_18050/g.24775 Transcript_18050/m.24775 type:complete len:89 (+) Transcript_18050:110-376(+)|eukprot:CAMPEP_0170131664 /NCGR_PEP_ID=MMETSP0020_2-20130122/23402_1 /TAXON_ID=98059 /ORGANISM="Dinobryon sp., Strain UTEXLB2267" /LENGTH=88 /DNA_ID=CAMNT_0010366821 /DNA_START=700 /DNA_END=966 /DNA_ORIENTATION=-
MLGDSLWYPLWDVQHVTQTASDIAANSLRSAVDSPVNLAQPTTFSTETIVSHDEVWTLLTNPSKASDPERLTTFLFELGLSKASDLVY